MGAVTNDATVDLAVIPGTLFTLISMVLFLFVVLRDCAARRRPPSPCQSGGRTFLLLQARLHFLRLRRRLGGASLAASM